jgi:5,6-dimethylbenzimidazole synthase
MNTLPVLVIWIVFPLVTQIVERKAKPVQATAAQAFAGELVFQPSGLKWAAGAKGAGRMRAACGEARLTRIPEFGAEFRAQLIQLFRWRRDVRRFKPVPVSNGALERLIEFGCLAPSVGLSQPWRFVIVDDATRRKAVRACFEQCNADALQAYGGDRAMLYGRLKLSGLDSAPSQVAVFADRSAAQGHGLGRQTMPSTIEYSAVMAIHTLWLAARAEGLGVGWISILEPQRIAAMNVPTAWTFIAYLCIGYPQREDDVPELEQEGWEQRCRPEQMIVRR